MKQEDQHIRPVKSFVIDEGKWSCARDSRSDQTLLSKNGSKCCLGFLALACGATTKEIADEGDLSRLGLSNFGLNGRVHDRAIAINDDWEMPFETKKEKLTELFKKRGIVVKFVDRKKGR